MMKKSGLLTVLLISSTLVMGQIRSMPFSKVVLRSDTLTFDSNNDVVSVNGEQRMYFKYQREDQVCEVRLFANDFNSIKNLHLLPSADFELLDSMVRIRNEYMEFRIKFLHLSASDFLNFNFNYATGGGDTSSTFNIPLLPYTDTNVALYTDDNQLFIGEEKAYELTSNHVQNIQVNNLWTSGKDINYRLSFENGHLYLHLISTTLGEREARISLHTIRPYIDSLGHLNYDLPVIVRTFNVKESRLRFLNSDTEEIILDNSNKNGYLIQLDNQPYFSLQKTYRVEDQEEPGGPLIAEIFTVSYLNNGRILCRIRPYALHRKSEGYLYLKDNDVARFILNINIIPRTVIKKVSVLHEGGDWTTDLSVHPGENIEVKIEGESLHNGEFSFEGLGIRSADSALSNDNVIIYKLRIPFKISLKNITLFHDRQKTGFSLTVKEYQRPRPFDYIYVETGGNRQLLNEVNGAIMVKNVIHDIVFSFDRNKIDSEGQLFGKQYLHMKVTINGRNNELIEIKDIDDIVICPGSYSPRALFYDSKGCTTGNVDLNQYLNKKTYDLDEWSRISVEVSVQKDQYDGESQSKNMEVILEKSWRFDIDVSFPAGLLTFGGGNTGTSLTGISMAMIAQFSFYEKNRINRFKPYKVGVGFIALDAFNFSNDSNNANRDIAMVLLGSLYPTRKDTKLTFPLYFGGGYKLKSGKFFFLIGPGIRVSF